MEWQGPFEVVRRVSAVDCQVKVNGKDKMFHINMLRYFAVCSVLPDFLEKLHDVKGTGSAVIQEENIEEDPANPNDGPADRKLEGCATRGGIIGRKKAKRQ